MPRIAFIMKLLEGHAEEYKRRHDELWPGLKNLLKEKGISQYSIFLEEKSLQLFGILTITQEQNLDQLSQEPVMQKWWDHMKDIMETRPDHSPVSIPLREVFFLP